MKRLNQNQIIGIGILLIGISASYFFNSTLMGVISGALAAVGVGLIFKWIPFHRKNGKNEPGF